MDSVAPPDAERRAVELEKLHAEILKLAAERQKIEREYEQLRRTHWDRAGEFVKIFGAVFAVLVAGFTAIATPQLIKLQTEIARRDKEAADRDREHAELAATRAKLQVAATTRDLLHARRERNRALAEASEALRERNRALVEANEVKRGAEETERKLIPLRDQAVKAKRDADDATQELGILTASKSQIARELDAARQELVNIRTEISQLRVTDASSIQRLKDESRVDSTVPTPQPFLFVSSRASFNEIASRVASEFSGSYKTHVRLADDKQRDPPGVTWTLRTELRYFRPADRDEAIRIADRLKQLTATEAKVSLVADSDVKQARYFDLRFECDCLVIEVTP